MSSAYNWILMDVDIADISEGKEEGFFKYFSVNTKEGDRALIVLDIYGRKLKL